MARASVYAISISAERGQLKREVAEANLIENHGIEGDGHAGDWGRQVTCLNWASVQAVNQGREVAIGPGGFAENILIDGLDFSDLVAGKRLRLGSSAVLEVTQVGKEDHPSVVTRTWAVSLLPSEGLFCRVVTGGLVRKGDLVEQIGNQL